MDSKYYAYGQCRSYNSSAELKRKQQNAGTSYYTSTDSWKKARLDAAPSTSASGSGSGSNRPQQNGKTSNELFRETLQKARRQLPVYAVRDRLMAEIREKQRMIIVGETGSGKTTQIPQFIYESGLLGMNGAVAITQPRRVAAISVSMRVAKEMGKELGTLVGYKVRFEDKTDETTRIKFVTDGTLLREAMQDKTLRKYRVIILDEAHERTVNTDVLFGIVKQAQELRKTDRSLPQLKVIVMSATMDVDHFAGYFKCKAIYLEGRAFNVRIMNVRNPPTGDYLTTCLGIIFDIHQRAPESDDILVFLTGQEEIDAMAATIRTIANSAETKGPRVKVYPLYAALAQKRQLEVFQPHVTGTRKIILATNIAETSITIRGIRFVVDSGVVKLRHHDPVTGIDTLKVTKISQAQAQQRAGRAGRESDGFCYRAYSLRDYDALPATTTPEIRRSNLATVILQLLNMRIDCQTFDFIDRPPREAITGALRQLLSLGAISDASPPTLTELGRRMSKFPLDAPYSRVLLAAKEFNCVEEMINIVAVLSGENFFNCPNERRDQAREAHAKFESRHGDHITMLRVFRAFLKSEQKNSWCLENFLITRHLLFAANVRIQLIEVCNRLGIEQTSCGSDTDAVRKCLLTGLFNNIAELQSDNHYTVLANRQRVKIHPSSVLSGRERPKFILFSELIATGKTYARTVTAIEPDWAKEAIDKMKRAASRYKETPSRNSFTASTASCSSWSASNGSSSSASGASAANGNGKTNGFTERRDELQNKCF